MKKIKMLMVFMAVMLTLALVPSTIRADEGEDVAPDYVAQIGEEKFESIQAALDKIEEGGTGTITLLKDVKSTHSILISNKKNVTFDLNGYDITFDEKFCFFVMDGTLKLDGPGKVEANNTAVYVYGTNGNGSTIFVQGEDVTLNGIYGVLIFGSENYGENGAGIDVTIGGTINASGDFGISVNGNIVTGDGPKISVDGATITVAGEEGIYLAGNNYTEIVDSTIKANDTGIEVRAGNVTIDNSTIEGGNGEYDVKANNNGSTNYNAALAIAQHTTKLPINVTINGGTFTATNALAEVNPQENKQEDIAKVELVVNGGTFKGEVYSENLVDFVKGGTFEPSLDKEYCVHNMQTAYDKDGHWKECTICGMKENEEAHDWWTPENGVEQCRVCPQKKADVKATTKTAATANVALPKTGVESHISVMPILMATGIVISAIATKKRH